MSTTRDPYDQANQLREKMKSKLNPDASSQDVLSLPPRSKVHKSNDQKKTTKVKFKFPLVRILAFLFVLLPIAILAYTIHHTNEIKKLNEKPDTYEKSVYKEEISLGSKTEVMNEHSPASEANEDIISGEESNTQEYEYEDTYKVVIHTVKSDETLYTISQHYYNSRAGEKLIEEWNELKTNEVEEGQVLKIPLE